MFLMTTGANLGLSLTLNLEQYEHLAVYDDEAGVKVCTIIHPFFKTASVHSFIILCLKKLPPFCFF